MSLPTMRRAKSIDEIMEEVLAAGCTMVVTNDAPLATALNSRIDRPQIGPFAYTARQIAGMLQYEVLGKAVLSDVEIVRTIQDELAANGYVWGFASVYNEVLNIREIRRYKSDVENYLHGPEKKIYSIYQSLETREALQNKCNDEIMERFYAGKKVAVVNETGFDQLDRHLLPPIGTYYSVDPLKDTGKIQIDKIYAIGNDRQVAESVVDLIDADGATDVAIVMNSDGPIADAVRASLYKKGIPFKNKLSVRDVSQIRDYLQFITLALSFNTLRVGDVRSLFQSFGASSIRGLNNKLDNNLLNKVYSSIETFIRNPNDRTMELLDMMSRIRDLTFEEVRKKLDIRGNTSSVSIQLESMDIEGHKVNDKDVSELAYAISNIQDLRHNEQIPEFEKKGVLLADCRNSVYIDRPVVFFVGMGTDWNLITPGKPYIDRYDLDDFNNTRMTVLLQQGESRIYAVKPYTDGEPTIPCETLSSVFDCRIEEFSDICGKDNYVKGSWTEEKDRHSLSESSTDNDLGLTDPPKADLTFYQSSFNEWRKCPLSFLFGIATPYGSTEDNKFSLYGNVFHWFAEFAFSYPDEVLKHRDDPDYYVDKLMAVYEPMIDIGNAEVERTRLRCNVLQVMDFVEEVSPIDSEKKRKPLTDVEKNPLYAWEGHDEKSACVENKEICEKYHMGAKYDLSIGNLIYDYKTKEFKQYVAMANRFSKINGSYDSQPLFYVFTRLMMSGSLDKPASFTLAYFARDSQDLRKFFTEGGYDVRKYLITAEYDPNMKQRTLNDIRNSVLDGNKKRIVVFEPKIDDVIQFVSERYTELDTSEKSVSDLLTVAGLEPTDVNIGAATDLLKNVHAFKASKKEVVISKEYLEKFGKEVQDEWEKASNAIIGPIYRYRNNVKDCCFCDYRTICLNPSTDAEGGNADE